MSERLDGKVAVVTGAGRGVGRAYAHALAAAGAAVVVNDVAAAEGSPAADVAAEIEAAGGRAIANTDSVADFEATAAMMGSAVEAFGRLDIVVANAGIIRPTYIVDATESDWADVLAVHANGTFNCIRHAAPQMIEQGEGGTIITTGDIATELWFPRISSYRAAKAAIVVLTQHAANELRQHDINVNSVMPGATETRMSGTFFQSLDDRLDSFLSDIQRTAASGSDSSGEIASPDTVPPLGVYLCTEEGRRFTGFSFQMSGPNVGVVSPHAEAEYIAPGEGAWTTEELAERVPGLLEGKRTLADATIGLDRQG